MTLIDWLAILKLERGYIKMTGASGTKIVFIPLGRLLRHCGMVHRVATMTVLNLTERGHTNVLGCEVSGCLVISPESQDINLYGNARMKLASSR